MWSRLLRRLPRRPTPLCISYARVGERWQYTDMAVVCGLDFSAEFRGVPRCWVLFSSLRISVWRFIGGTSVVKEMIYHGLFGFGRDAL